LRSKAASISFKDLSTRATLTMMSTPKTARQPPSCWRMLARGQSNWKHVSIQL